MVSGSARQAGASLPAAGRPAESAVLAAPTPYGLFITDPGGTVLGWSEGATRLYGLQAAAVTGQLGLADLVQDADMIQRGGSGPLECARRDGSWQGTCRRDRDGGGQLIVHAIVTPLPGSPGSPAGYLVLARDVSAELRETERLKDAEFRARSLFGANSVALLTTDLLGVITGANHPAEVLFGRDVDQLDGTSLAQYATVPDLARQVMSDVLAEGTVQDREITIRRADGGRIPVLAAAGTFTDREGGLQGVLATLLDLTARQDLQQDLVVSEAHHRGLIEAAADGLAAVDARGLITDVNQRLCGLAGVTRDELIGSSFALCFEDQPRARDVVSQAFTGSPVTDYELRLRPADGPVRRVSLNASLFTDPREQAAGMVASIRDVTAQAELRDRLADERAYSRNVIEASANGLVISDLTFRIRDVNGTFCRLAQRGRDELAGTAVAECFADPPSAARLLGQALAGDEVTGRELQLGNPQRSASSVNVTVLRRDSGEAAGLLLSIRDMSEELQLRHALAAQQAYSRTLIETAPTPLFEITRDGLIAGANAAAAAVTGLSLKLLPGRSFSELFSDPAAARQVLERAFADGQASGVELSMTAPGPRERVLSLNGGAVRDPRDQREVALFAARDITRDRDTREQLHFYTQSMYAATTDAILISDVTGRVRDANHQMEIFCGRPRDELAGTEFGEHFTDPERARGLLRAVLRDGKASDFELVPAHPDDSTTVLSFSAWTFNDSQGRLRGIVASARDITEQKKLLELQASMLARAHELDQSKSDFVARISHELRSPLTSILGFLEVVADNPDEPLSDEQRRMIEVVARNGRRLWALIEDLLLMSGIETGDITVSYRPVEVGPLIQQVRESFQPDISERHLAASVSGGDGVWIDADPEQLRRAITNLLSNAVKFTPPGGEITVGCRPEGDEVAIWCRDTGIGVPAAEQHRLFTRFFRSSVSLERETQGTGLGLFIVKQIAQAHAGSVSAESLPGTGSTFTLRLPRQREPATGRPRPPGGDAAGSKPRDGQLARRNTGG